MLGSLIILVVAIWAVYSLIMAYAYQNQEPGAEALAGFLERFAVDSYRVPKIPSFFKKDPKLWFAQVESTFRSARITDENTKAHHIIANLDFEVIEHIKDLITAEEPPSDLYD